MNAGAYDRLEKQIKAVCEFDLAHREQAFYLLFCRGDWLLTTYPHRGAKLIGWFSHNCTQPQFKYAVYAAVNKARPG